MNRNTKEWLYHLLWLMETLSRPTFRNLTDSFEGWASRRGLLLKLHQLEKEELLESLPGLGEQRTHTLTAEGRRVALGGRDPEACWSRDWDGQWRLVVFDLPEIENTLRVRLRRFLKDRHFGYLQNSVWITPDPLDSIAADLHGFAEDVQALIILQARACGGESNAAIVNGAWNFEKVNQTYCGYLEVLEQLGQKAKEDRTTPQRLRQFLQRERSHWLEAVSIDPLLPESLLPAVYLGKEAWRARRRLAQALVV
ncbi:MAG: hypothetical protein HY735_23110 [Verrucomicrobia bacterium]|nr:hypothetical protein [Verrucomicrobiota bacterium]